jgi:hypothetical protein
MSEAPSPAYVANFLATSDGLSLTKAFMRIKNSKLADASSIWSNKSPALIDLRSESHRY